MKSCVALLVATVAIPTVLFGQERPSAPAADGPSFEVASIRRGKPDAQGKYGGMRGSQFYATNLTVGYMISWAYDLHPSQLSDGPGWIYDEKFDVVATPSLRETPSMTQLRLMVQKLLADRFALVLHKDRKQLAVYTISPGKSMPRLKESTAAAGALPALTFNSGSIVARNATLKDFADVLQSNVLDRPVLDKTGLTGHFDFTLNWTPDDFQYAGRGAEAARQAGPMPSWPSIFAAFEDQLGLRLESTKAQADVFVIDRVQKPSEN